MKFLSSNGIKKEEFNNDTTNNLNKEVKVMVEPSSINEQQKINNHNTSQQNVANNENLQISRIDSDLNIKYKLNSSTATPDEIDGLLKDNERRESKSSSTNSKIDDENDNQTKSHESIVKKIFKKFSLSFIILLSSYLIGYFKFSFAWLLICLVIYIVCLVHKYRSKVRLLANRELNENERKFIERVFIDLPNWVIYPDHERVEFLNKTFKQMWPHLNLYIQKFLKEEFLPNIRGYLPDYMKSIKFDTIDLGNVPLRIGSIKCHDRNSRKEILFDIQLIYAGNANFKLKWLKFGAGIKDLQLFGNLRLRLYPLTDKLPLIGSVSLTFLNCPKFDFNLTNLLNLLDVPGLSELIRKVILDQICSYFVYPNVYVIPLSDIPIKSLKFNPPLGIIRLEIIEAKDLLKADYGILGMVSSFCLQTQVIPNTINPHFLYICELAIGDLDDQEIEIEVYDKDQNTADDFLGRLTLRLAEYDCTGEKSQWIPLEDTTTGCIHIKLTWLKLSSDLTKLENNLRNNERIKLIYNNSMQSLKSIQPKSTISSELNEISFASSFCCMIYLDSIRYLPKIDNQEPSIYVDIILGQRRRRSILIENNCNPLFEQNFLFLTDLLQNEPPLKFEIYDSKSKKVIGKTALRLDNLVKEKRLTFDSPITVRIGNSNGNLDCILNVAIELRVLYQSGFKGKKKDSTHKESLKTVISMDRIENDRIERNIIIDETTEKNHIPSLDEMVRGTVEPIKKLMEYEPEQSNESTKDIDLNKSSGELDINHSNKAESNLSIESKSTPSLTNLIHKPQIGITIENLNDFNYKPIKLTIHKVINLPDQISTNTFYKIKIRRFPFRDKKQVCSKKIYNTNSPEFNECFNLVQSRDAPLTQLELRFFRGKYCKMFKIFQICRQIERVVIDLTQFNETNITQNFDLEEFPKHCDHTLESN